MDSEQKQFLALTQRPARLNAEQTAWFLGFQVHDIPIVVASGHLKPLGQPSANGAKYFASVELEELRGDRRWLARATTAVQEFWRKKNSKDHSPAVAKPAV